MILEDLALYIFRILGGLIPLLMLAMWVLVGYAMFRGVQAALLRMAR